MKHIPEIHPEMRWARFVYPNFPIGPWFGASPRKPVKNLVFGTPAVGDLVLPHTGPAEVLGEVSQEEAQP